MMEQVKKRLERERAAVTARLRQMGGAIAVDEMPDPVTTVFDDADHIQVNEQREMGLASRERLAERLVRLTAALARVEDGTYGTCVECGEAIRPARLKAIPEAATCVPCQERIERRF